MRRYRDSELNGSQALCIFHIFNFTILDFIQWREQHNIHTIYSFPLWKRSISLIEKEREVKVHRKWRSYFRETCTEDRCLCIRQRTQNKAFSWHLCVMSVLSVRQVKASPCLSYNAAYSHKQRNKRVRHIQRTQQRIETRLERIWYEKENRFIYNSVGYVGNSDYVCVGEPSYSYEIT
jgi:hypothetical protein